MTRYKKGDVVYASIPYTDLSEIGEKYALVVLITTGEDLTLCRITKVEKNLPNRIPIYKEDFSSGGLRISPSFVLIDNFVTIHSDLVKKKVGSLKQEKIKEIAKEISTLILD